MGPRIFVMCRACRAAASPEQPLLVGLWERRQHRPSMDRPKTP
ncbi:hypothetical protein BZL30_8921 [Mycobacterium kansasii]|uniref:Uncharacterized protein n=1 Tax=Mycobacterium kansasii TaxID=1768 RepID=A0A1V3WDX0_MYCKA|nr:hypothetical protein BZL30_8921 [Mycobacterium kansasii]